MPSLANWLADPKAGDYRDSVLDRLVEGILPMWEAEEILRDFGYKVSQKNLQLFGCLASCVISTEYTKI